MIKNLFCLLCLINLQTIMAIRPGRESRTSVTSTQPWPHKFKRAADHSVKHAAKINAKAAGGSKSHFFTGKQMVIAGAFSILLVSKGLFWMLKKQAED